MTTTTTTHVNFRGEARAALAFYGAAFDVAPTVVTFADLGDLRDGAVPDQVVWGEVAAPGGFHLMAFDVPPGRPHDAGHDAFYVSLRCTTEDEVRAAWAGLSDGASIRTDLGPAPFSPLYGMLTDRFGVTWVIDLTGQHAG